MPPSSFFFLALLLIPVASICSVPTTSKLFLLNETACTSIYPLHVTKQMMLSIREAELTAAWTLKKKLLVLEHIISLVLNANLYCYLTKVTSVCLWLVILKANFLYPNQSFNLRPGTDKKMHSRNSTVGIQRRSYIPTSVSLQLVVYCQFLIVLGVNFPFDVQS